MLKKIFCNHEYVYVDKEHVINFPGSDYYLFRFMCKKCRKTVCISSSKIEKIKQKYQNKLAEMVAVDGFVDNSNAKITISARRGYYHVHYRMTGWVADKTNDYFRRRYHVDLKDIPLD